MWGNIVTEVALQTNFGIGFNNTKSDVLIHLTQWQYWWWFWFSFLWAFYYLIILKIVRFRTLKFKPKIATTLRPHGKWGDLIICLIPISWCANIITNSTLILRMIEWQSETGLLTIRIRGKQWYWIYKFELKTFTDILSVPKNIGRNKWVVFTPNEMQVADDYLHINQLRSMNKWIVKYWHEFIQKFSKRKDGHLLSVQEQLKYEFYDTYNKLKKYNFFGNAKLRVYDYKWVDNLGLSDLFDITDNYTPLITKNNLITRLLNKKKSWDDSANLNLNKFYIKKLIFKNFSLINNRKNQTEIKESIYNYLTKTKIKDVVVNNTLYNYNDFLEVNRLAKRKQGNTPLRLIKYPISNKSEFSVDNEIIELFRFRFSDNENNVKHKPAPHSTFLTLKQKRYKRRKAIPLRNKFEKLPEGGSTKIVRLGVNPYLFNNEHIIENFGNPTKQYNLLKKNKTRYENTSLVLSKRLLRTRRTLVLPAHVNITAVTNSYDVVHSWFIPGLGLKMDCIPGRATHHNFYIDNVGFYYGQCAEICGRYHHHMPIRICALPFEHFLLWWHTFGLPKLLFTKNIKRVSYHYGSRKFKW